MRRIWSRVWSRRDEAERDWSLNKMHAVTEKAQIVVVVDDVRLVRVSACVLTRLGRV